MDELWAVIARYQELTAGAAGAFFVVFLRVGSAMSVLPAFGEQSIPMRFRLIIALCLTMAVFPSVYEYAIDQNIAYIFIKEIIIGLFVGLALRFFIFALASAGIMIANTVSLSQLFTQGPEPQMAVSQVLILGGLAIALQMGLPVRLVLFLINTYEVLPINNMPDIGMVASWMVDHGGRMFSLSFMIALPFLAASLLYNVALGVINRAMPQLMVAAVGAPAQSLGGFMMLAIVIPIAIAMWVGVFNDFLSTPIGQKW